MVSIWKWRASSPFLHELTVSCLLISTRTFPLSFLMVRRLVLMHRRNAIFANHGCLETSMVLIWNSQFTASLPLLCLLNLDVFKHLRLRPLSIWTSTASWMSPHLILRLLAFTIVVHLSLILLLTIETVTLPYLHMLRQSVELLHGCWSLSLTRNRLGSLRVVLVKPFRLLLR